MIHLDTNVCMILVGAKGECLPAGARRALGSADRVLSPMVVLELEYLYEIGRIRRPAVQVTDWLAERLGVSISPQPFSYVVRHASQVKWTRDPFDRIIVGQAALDDAILVTRDEMILKNYPRAVWD